MERPFALGRRRGAKISNGLLIHMALLTGEGVKDASSLAALLVHSRRPPSFSSNQVCSFVERRPSLGADLVESLTHGWLFGKNSILNLWLSVVVFCVIGLDVVKGKLASLLERINVLDGLVGGGIDGHDEDGYQKFGIEQE
jgi:hypothetical protein